MLKLTQSDITLNQIADDKITAIKAIANQLTEKGLVAEQYLAGMLNREKQNSTFLGNGIAIPHGTTDTRNLVNKTGVVVHQFPEGVNWGDGNTVYVAIGIAAKSDEHLSILKKLTKALSDDGVEQKLQQAKNKNDIIDLLNGDVQFKADFSASLIQLNFPATDMIQMAAVAGGLLKNNHNVDNKFVANLITKEPTHLGGGLWLISGEKSVKRAGMSFLTTSENVELNGLPVKGLIAIAACNTAHCALLNILTELIFSHQQLHILSANVEDLLKKFSQDLTIESDENAENIATFKINNIHGLHARPSAMLVATIKKFTSSVTVSNLDGDNINVDAKNLMKVVSLGVKHGHSLLFIANGDDAKEALLAIGDAISSGLSEG